MNNINENAAWHKVFTSGSEALKSKLKKTHAKNPKFQEFLKSIGHEGAQKSVAQAKKDVGDINKKKARMSAIATAATSKKNKELVSSSERVREMGRRRREGGEGLGGGLETNRDIISYVKSGGTIKAGRLGEKVMLHLLARCVRCRKKLSLLMKQRNKKQKKFLVALSKHEQEMNQKVSIH
jgi:hypothetical protein